MSVVFHFSCWFYFDDNSFSNLPPAMIKICLTLAKLEGAYQITYYSGQISPLDSS